MTNWTLKSATRQTWPWLLVAPFGSWALLRLTGFDDWFPVAQLIAFTPYVAAAALLPVLNIVAARRWAPAALAAAVAFALMAAVVPRWTSDSDQLAGANGPILRVMIANVLKGEADPAALAELVRANQVDVLLLQELTWEFAEAVDEAGLADLLPHRVLYPRLGTEGSGVLSKFALRDDGVRVNPGQFHQAMAELFLPDGRSVLVESAHPFSPYAADAVELWRDSFPHQPRATVDGPLRILAGDFNATLDHSVLRDLIGSGYRDAASVVGAGLVGTWGPYDGDLIPPVVIDHVLADRRIGVREVEVFDLPGSDHRSVLAELSLP